MHDITNLRSFCSVVEFCSVKKAAEAFSVTPSSITKRVSAVEKELCTKLFEQDGRGIKPTKEGFDFYKKAKTTIESMESLFVGFKKEVQIQKSKQVRIAYHFALGEAALPDVILDLHSKIQDPIITITETDYDTAIEGLLNGTFDIALYMIEETSPKNERFTYEKLFKIDYKVVVNNLNPLSKKAIIKIEDIKSEKILFMDRANISASFLLGLMRVNGIKSFIQMNGVKWNTILSMVAKNLGITIIGSFYRDFLSPELKSLLNFIDLDFKYSPQISAYKMHNKI